MKCPDLTTVCRWATGLLIVLAGLPLSAGVYYWTDEKGVKHYSNVAPPESVQEIQRVEEIPPKPPENQVPGGPDQPAPPGSAPSAGTAPAEDSAPTNSETEKKSAAEGPLEPETAAGAVRVLTDQNEIVQSEKSVVKALQRQLEQNASQRDQMIERERLRLTRALEKLQEIPVSEFGSQKNKIRVLGYYRYRLEALLNSPDAYFAYGDSDID